MAQFNNLPKFIDGKVLRYVHQPLTIEHHGTNITIKENGQVMLSKVIGPDPDNSGENMVDEIQVSASLIFKTAGYLRDTRKAIYVSPEEATKMGSATVSD